MSPIAPRWAGYTAALLGLHYTVSKLVMAARGELGVPGHPAPLEAYDGFEGSVVAAQLGNAALGAVAVLTALALVQGWGRRIPPPLLAAAAIVALLGGLAGALGVIASLTGLREDHGQWGVDSLVLGLVPLGAWAVLTGWALRAARVGVAALTAGGLSAAYGAMKLHWALGGETLMRQAPLPDHALQDMLARQPGTVAGHWVSVALALTGVALAAATVRPARLPRILVAGLPLVIGGLMLARATWGAASDVAVLSGAAGGSSYTAGWDLLLWSPAFAAWGVAWLLAARRAGLASRAWPPLRPRAPGTPS